MNEQEQDDNGKGQSNNDAYRGNNTANGTSPNNHNKALFLLIQQLLSLTKNTVETSTKILSPSLLKLVSYTLEIAIQFLQHVTPVRIQHWYSILQSSIYHGSTTIRKSSEGQDFIYEIRKLQIHLTQLLTCTNTRQLIIDTMASYVKAIDALSSTEMKTFISSLPIFYIRFIDTLSSGTTKELVHSISDAFNSCIQMLNSTESIVALADVTAQIVHVLEMEYDVYQPLYKKRRSGSVRRRRRMRSQRRRWLQHVRQRDQDRYREKRESNSSTNDEEHGEDESNKDPQEEEVDDDDDLMAIKMRYSRNRYIRQTYTNRLLLNKNDRDDSSSKDSGRVENTNKKDTQRIGTVEDAILSSLGDTTHLNNDSAWLTRLGQLTDRSDNKMDDDDNYDLDNEGEEDNDGRAKNDNDEDLSLPSSVFVAPTSGPLVVETKNSINTEEDNDDGNQDNMVETPTQSQHHPSNTPVNITYLRAMIEQRSNDIQRYRQRNKINQKEQYQQPMNERKESDSINQCNDKPPPVLNTSIDNASIEKLQNEDREGVDIEDLRKNCIPSDNDLLNNNFDNPPEKANEGLTSKPLKFDDISCPSHDFIEERSTSSPCASEQHEAVPSLMHFYRTLDEIQMKKKEEVMSSLSRKEMLSKCNHHNKEGQNVHEGGRVNHFFRFPWHNTKDPTSYLHEQSDTFEKNSSDLTMIDLVEKALQLLSFRWKLSILTFFIFSFVWFGFGCYGMYKLCSACISTTGAITIPHIFPYPNIIHEPPKQNEIVIRIVREVVHVTEEHPQKESSGMTNEGLECNAFADTLSHEKFNGEEDFDTIESQIIDAVAHNGRDLFKSSLKNR